PRPHLSGRNRLRWRHSSPRNSAFRNPAASADNPYPYVLPESDIPYDKCLRESAPPAPGPCRPAFRLRYNRPIFPSCTYLPLFPSIINPRSLPQKPKQQPAPPFLLRFLFCVKAIRILIHKIRQRIPVKGKGIQRPAILSFG